MRSKVSPLFLIVLLLAAEAAAEFRVGLSVGSVTPGKDELATHDYYMGGYGLWTERGPATGVHDKLSTRAFCVEADGAFCLAVVDSLGIPGPVVEQIQAVASLQTGLAPEQILIGSTHTHAAPDLLGLWGGSPDSYRKAVIDETASTITNAWRGKMPSRIFHGEAPFEARNRRGWDFIDDQLNVLVVRDPGDTTNLAVLVNAGIHPVVAPGSNRELSSDFVHYLREALTKAFRAPTIFVNGTLGDVTPGARESDYWAQASALGQELADIATGTTERLTEVEPTIEVRTQIVELPVDNLVLGMAQFFGLLDGSVSGPPWDQSVATSLTRVRLGNLSLVTVPGEPLTRFGLKMKEQQPGVMVLGQVGDSLGYIVPTDEWEKGRNNNYEESISLGAQTAVLIERAIEALFR